MLANAGFEGEYVRDSGTVLVAAGWMPFWATGDPPQETQQGPCAMPEYKPLPRTLDAERVVEGETAQCWFLNWKVMDAGVHQTVEADEGSWYQFSASLQAWCDKGNDPRVSQGEMYVSLGIDPYGVLEPFRVGVMWSPWQWVSAEHRRLESPVVLARHTRITVLVRAWNKWRLRHNDVYVDAARLEEVDVGGGSGPGPAPGEGVDYGRIRGIVREELRDLSVTLS